MSKRSARLMAKAFLHSSRRTALNTQGEPILLTSFYWRRRGPVTILWSEVRGAVTIKSFESITAKNLRSVWGYFYSSTEEDVNLHNLKYVGGDFDIGSLQLRVRNLAVVGGGLMVCEPDLPNLESVGKRFWVSWASELRVPYLRYVAGTHLPHFCNLSAGGVIAGIAKHHPRRRITVVCGHTHCHTQVNILDNLEVRVGGAQRGAPNIQEILDVH